MLSILTDVTIKDLLAMPTSNNDEVQKKRQQYRNLGVEFSFASVDEAIAMEQAITVKQLRDLCNDYRDNVKVMVMIKKDGSIFAPMVFPMGEYIKPARNIVLRIGDEFTPRI